MVNSGMRRTHYTFFCKEFSHSHNPVQNVLATWMVLADCKDGTTAIATSSHVWFLKRIERTFFGLQIIQAATIICDRGECPGSDRPV